MVNLKLDYLGFLQEESARFAAAIAAAAPDQPVAACPDWTADDLLWHLGRVQWRWATIVREGLTGEQAAARAPRRPADRAGLLGFVAQASGELGAVLAAAPPDTPAWTWSADRTIGFIRRKQAHEALIHRVDAEAMTGSRTPMDPALSADGVDEVLRIMYGALPGWAVFRPAAGRTLRIRATDTGHTWLVRLGQFTGTDPADGTRYNGPDIHAVGTDPGGAAAALAEGSAADLDCWLWHRQPAEPVELSGDKDTICHFEAAIAPGIS